MLREEKNLGIGCIEHVLTCDRCRKQYYIGLCDRTDGNGEYRELDDPVDTACREEVC